MPAWLWPAVKLILPHVGNIVAAAKPAFTRQAADPVEQADVVQRQIAELQSAASQNATHVKELAEQLRLTITALEQSAAETEKRLRRTYAFATVAAVLGSMALAVAVYAVAV
jgi:hypothetical protein